MAATITRTECPNIFGCDGRLEQIDYFHNHRQCNKCGTAVGIRTLLKPKYKYKEFEHREVWARKFGINITRRKVDITYYVDGYEPFAQTL